MIERVEQAFNANEHGFKKTFHQFCRQGDVEAIQSLLEHKTEIDIDISSKGKNTALHSALIHNQQGLVIDFLISRGANVNAFNTKGYNCVIFSIINCQGALALEKLIRAGAIWNKKYQRGKFSGLSLPEIAIMYKNNDAANLLKRLHAEEDQRGREEAASGLRESSFKDQKNCKLCPICNTFVRFPSKLSYVEQCQRVQESKALELEEERLVTTKAPQGEPQQPQIMKESYTSRKYLDQFLSHESGAYEKLLRVENHGINNKSKLRKEISESFSILHAVQDCCIELSLLPHTIKETSELHLENIFLIDLCAGKSLTTALCGALFPPEACPQNTFLAVDRLPVHLVPHFPEDGNTSYLSRDIMTEKFFLEMKQDVDRQTRQGKTVILVGMHLCGNLSERAIDLFEYIPSINALVLCPCCLPKMRMKSTKPSSAFLSYIKENGGEKYEAWSSYLKDKIQDLDPKDTSLHIKSYHDTEMHSVRNSIIIATRK